MPAFRHFLFQITGYLPRKKEISTPKPPTKPSENISRPRGTRFVSGGASVSKSGREIGAGGVNVASRVGVCGAIKAEESVASMVGVEIAVGVGGAST